MTISKMKEHVIIISKRQIITSAIFLQVQDSIPSTVAVNPQLNSIPTNKNKKRRYLQ